MAGHTPTVSPAGAPGNVTPLPVASTPHGPRAAPAGRLPWGPIGIAAGAPIGIWVASPVLAVIAVAVVAAVGLPYW